MTPPKGGALAPLRSFVRGKEDPLLEMRNALGMAAGTLKAQPVLGTRIINITAESTIPDIGAGFVNAIVAEYMSQSAQQRTISTEKTSQWLESQLEETRVKVKQAETRLQNFVRQSGATFAAGDKETLASSKLRDIQAELAALQTDRILKQSKYEQVKSVPPDSLPDVVDDAVYRQDQAKLAELKQDLAKLTLTLTPANPKVQRVQEQIVELTADMQKEKENILQRYRTDYESVQRHEQLVAAPTQARREQFPLNPTRLRSTSS